MVCLVNTVSHSRRLRDKIRLARAEMDATAEALWTHPRLREIYPEFLFRNHSVIRASVPLMKAAAEACEKKQNSDALAGGMLPYFQKHIPEETGHDEWVLDDLETLGFRREDVLKRMPSPFAAALVGAQYYWIRHVHPVALLGFIAVLEGTPPDVEFFEATADRIGVPRRAFSNLLLHGKLDPQHRDDLDHALDALPLTESHHALMGVSAFQTINLLTRVAGEAVQ
ncbi:MAG: iron-containing redox enzyme family protein [Candidatus Korobacteraceae bacterium]